MLGLATGKGSKGSSARAGTSAATHPSAPSMTKLRMGDIPRSILMIQTILLQEYQDLSKAMTHFTLWRIGPWRDLQAC
jgi:hypothetical protein